MEMKKKTNCINLKEVNHFFVDNENIEHLITTYMIENEKQKNALIKIMNEEDGEETLKYMFGLFDEETVNYIYKVSLLVNSYFLIVTETTIDK